MPKTSLLFATIMTALMATAALAHDAAPTSAPLKMTIGGRVARTTDPVTHRAGWIYQWPGVYFEAQFTGSQVSLDFNDPSNTFNVLIDDRKVMQLDRPGQRDITISVPAGPHHIRLEKRSETQDTTGVFYGFYTDAATQPPPVPARPRQIEFIGDSATVGYGNTSAFTQCTQEDIFETTDAQEGFGPLTAKHFNADYQINAFSGLGMVRNYDGREHAKYHMPMLYDRAVFDDPAPVDQPGWHPQIIVIMVGGNDFSTPVRPDEPWHDLVTLRADYVKTYTAFVKTVRARNPGAFIILATPPHREEGYDGGTNDVFAAEKATGDTRIDRLTLPELHSTGCNGHPNVRSDAEVAQMYIAYIDAHPELWQGR